MRLKKLQLLGFKTFADKTEIEIGEGLTAIVGPNGSGKSNIVDALLWVLGEQNPRLLRGNSAQDVIFAGTDKRKPVGMAEVKLTIDNSDGTLPIKFGEVVIARRLYRSGESQYLINGAPCRLKDIVELFLDTGAGKGAYAFVSQQEIDAVLSARPEDRRELFEEAAGIKKYRVKKREAMRKLESADANLNRVRDIIAELEVQREPLERQSIIARRYLLLQERLHEIEVGMLVGELHKADYELHASKTERDADQTALLRVDAELARLERASIEVGERLGAAEQDLDAARATHQSWHSASERAGSQLALLDARTKSADSTREQAAADLQAISAQIEALSNELAMNQSDYEEVEALERDGQVQWSASKSSLIELEAAVKSALDRAEERQSERIRMAQQKAALEADLKAVQVRIADVELRSERLLQEAARIHQALEEARVRATAAREAIERAKCQSEALAREREELERVRRQALVSQAALRSSIERARRSVAEQSSRLSTLKELQESHEGFYQGVRAVLAAVKRGSLTGHFKAVVDLLTVPEPYRVAIEVALGGSLQDIVTITEAEARAGIEWLKQNRAGRATFLALPLLRPGNRLDRSNRGSGSSSDGEVGMDIVQYDARYAPAIQLLLGRVLVVADMDAAIALSRQAGGWSKIVTLAGEVLSPGGALTGGSLQGRGAHLIGRKGEIDDLNAAIPALNAEVSRLTTELDRVQAELSDLDAAFSAASKQEAALASESATAAGALSSAEREILQLMRDRQDRMDAESGLKTLGATLRSDSDRIKKAVEAGFAEFESAEDAYSLDSEQAREFAAQRDACRTATVALEVEVGRLRERREGLTRAIAADRAALSRLQQDRLNKQSQRESAERIGEEAVGDRKRLEAELAESQRQLSLAESALDAAVSRRQAVLSESSATTTSLRETMQRRADTTRSLHDVEVRLARLEIQAAQAVTRLQDEYSISREEALAMPENTTIDRGTAMEVGRLRRELRGMGQVNTGAVEEYERLTERYEYLTSQRSDLDNSRISLLKTIEEIDDSTRGVFTETFEAVRVEFDRIFKRLFDGGTTRLLLTDPSNVLDTGIEVIAQPPGKKAQSLSLLSGGERALTASALLFAFLAVRPSPFVLLDEVDASLDGANVERFANLVCDSSERSQFLLITHNPTTIEAAPNWYGVTMREPGISSVISYRVPAQAAVSS